MPNIYSSAVKRIQDDEVERIKALFRYNGIKLVDTGFITSKPDHKMGTVLPSIVSRFYRKLMGELLPSANELEVTFPEEMRIEFERYLVNQRNGLEKARERAETYGRAQVLSRLVDNLASFAERIELLPTEVYLGGKEEVFYNIRDAVREVALRNGTGNGLEEHLTHDADIMAKALTVGKVTGRKVYVLTRDPHLSGIKRSLLDEREGLQYLADSYWLPLDIDDIRKVKVVNEQPATQERRERIRELIECHLEMEKIAA